MTTGHWGAKSPDNEKIVAMAAEINALKGQLKLNPKLSAIAKDNKKKDNKGDNKKDTNKRRIRRILPTRNSERETRNGRRCHPRMATPRKSKWADLPFSGVSTTWHGRPTSLRTAGSIQSTKTTKGGRRATTRPTPLSLHPRPLLTPPASTIATRLSWPQSRPSE